MKIEEMGAFEVLIAGKVFVAVGVFPAAEVAVAVLLLHVLVDLLAAVEVHFEERGTLTFE
jgi:hypothetical protein